MVGNPTSPEVSHYSRCIPENLPKLRKSGRRRVADAAQRDRLKTALFLLLWRQSYRSEISMARGIARDLQRNAYIAGNTF